MKKILTRESFIARAVVEYERKYGIPSGWWATRNDIRSPGGYRITRSTYKRFVVSKLDGRGKRVFFGAFRTRRKAVKKVRQLESMLAQVTAPHGEV